MNPTDQTTALHFSGLFPENASAGQKKVCHMSEDILGDRLEKEYEKLRKSEKQLRRSIGKQMETSSFSCCLCGKCCRREYGDNSVFIRPEEVSLIAEKTGLSVDEITSPLFPDIFDVSPDGSVFISEDIIRKALEETADQIAPDGRIRAFGRILRRKSDGSCRFLSDDGKCTVYDVRPLLCRTYPFWVEDGKVIECECEGLGKPVSPGGSDGSGEDGLQPVSRGASGNDARRTLVNDLTDRYISETGDMVRTYRFIRENPVDDGGTEEGLNAAVRNLCSGFLLFIVYDSSGISEMTEKLPWYGCDRRISALSPHDRRRFSGEDFGGLPAGSLFLFPASAASSPLHFRMVSFRSIFPAVVFPSLFFRHRFSFTVFLPSVFLHCFSATVFSSSFFLLFLIVCFTCPESSCIFGCFLMFPDVFLTAEFFFPGVHLSGRFITIIHYIYASP